MARQADLDALAREMQGRDGWRGSLLLGVILLFFLAALAWAALTEIDDVTRAPGRIVPARDVQMIQTSEAGVLTKLHVRAGDIVASGQVLMDLDGVQATARLDQEQQRAYGLMARIARLQAMIDDTDLQFPDTLRSEATAVVRSERALYRARRTELVADLGILERQRLQRQEELAEAEGTLTTVRAVRALLEEERAITEPLVTRGLGTRASLLELRQREAEAQGEERRARARMARLRAGLAEIDDQIAARRARARAAALSELSLATAELAALQPSLPALRDRAARTVIRAPLRGVVNRVHRTTLGGLVRPGEDLIEIVPLDDSLLVEAYIRPADIAFVYPGQPVKVKITAYDFARYGALEGEILRIGADAVTRSARTTEEVFVAEIRTEGTFLDADGETVEVIPGMIAEIDMLSGRKSVLDYLTMPVMRVKERAFRE